jgi:hypothetical protein
VIAVDVRLAGLLIGVGLAVGAVPTVAGVARSKGLSAAAVALSLGGVLGLAANLTARRRQPCTTTKPVLS